MLNVGEGGSLRMDVRQQVVDYVIKNKNTHYRLAYSYVKNVEDALDIVQESIYKAFSSIESLENPNYIKTWFYKIVINTSMDFLRKRKKLINVDDEFFSTLDSGTNDNYEDFDLKKALEELPDKYRSLIVLRYFEDLKIEEIANIVNLNVNTVKSQLYKSLRKLHIKMEDQN